MNTAVAYFAVVILAAVLIMTMGIFSTRHEKQRLAETLRRDVEGEHIEHE